MKRRAFAVMFVAAPLLLAGAESGAQAAAGGNQTVAVAAPILGQTGTFPEETIQLGDVTREYRLVVPDSVDLSKPAPIVFAFHGMGEDSKDHMPEESGLNATAAEHKFILVYPGARGGLVVPQGVVKAWALSADRAVEDIEFFDALLARLQSLYKIDPDRIYLTGMSNGAYFAHLLARERADTIAAVAAHSGDLGPFDLSFIEQKRKFPVMIIHGGADPIFPVENARSARDLYLAAGHPVKYVEIPGLGHAWAKDTDIDEQIWGFFNSHPLHAPPASPAATPPAAKSDKP